MKTMVEKDGLTVLVDGHSARVLNEWGLAWQGNVPEETTAYDVYNMYMAQTKES